jgi:putative cyclase
MLIDLSREVTNTVGEPDEVTITVLTHEDGAELLGERFGITKDDFPDSMAINNERLSLTTHTSTHMDSPYHYGPISEGKKAKRIDEVPLEWCVNNGIVIDLSSSTSEEPITKNEISEYLKKYELILTPLTIVFINTGSDNKWGSQEFFTNFRGVSRDAIDFLLDFGVKVIGVDSFSVDPPFDKMLKRYDECRDSSVLWPAHILGRSREYCQIERLTNLNLLPKNRTFQVFCAPIKLKKLGAAWCRVIAVV